MCHASSIKRPEMEIFKAEHLKVFYPLRGGVFNKVMAHVKAVNDVSIDAGEGEIVSVVGESGCGKSTFGLAAAGLVPITSGALFLDGHGIDVRNTRSWTPFRNDFQIIFQDPFTSLNPRHTIYKILSEPLLVHKVYNKRNVKDGVAELLEQVGLSPDYMYRFPHAFSGGQRQRIAIARAVGLHPRVIICDEIASSLDVSVQAQIISLLLDLRKQMGLTLLFITHDLSLVKLISDRIYVMYLGKILETAPTENIYRNPAHPYTEALLNSIPTLDRNRKPRILEGDVPSPVDTPEGCFFKSRCPYSKSVCAEAHPELKKVNSGFVSCYFPLSVN